MTEHARFHEALSLAIVFGAFLISSCSDDPAAPQADGASSFSRMIGTAQYDETSGITVQSDGTRIVSGTFYGSLFVTGAADSLVSAGSSNDIFLVAFDPNGALVWKRAYDAPGAIEVPYAISRNASDALFVVGTYRGSTTLAGTNLSANGVDDVLIAKLDSDGEPMWVVGSGSSGNDWANDVATAQDGGAFVCGTADGQITLAGESFGEANQSGFLVRLSSLGGVAWSATASGPGNAQCTALVRAGDGSVWVAGMYVNDDVTFGGSTFPANGGYDGFVARYSDAGDPMSAIRIGGAGTSMLSGIALIDGDVLVAGRISGTVDFDLLTSGGEEIADGVSDAFVARYRANGTLAWVRVFGGSGTESATDACTIGGGELLVTGEFEGTFTFGSTTLTTNGDQDIFMVRMRGDGSLASAAKVGSAGEDRSPRVASAGESAILVGSTAGETRFSDGTIRSGFGDNDQFIYQR